MGKKRITDISEEKVEKVKKVATPEIKESELVVEEVKTEATEEVKEKTTPKAPRIRGKKYKEVKLKVDVEKIYPLSEALALLKETSITKFDSTAEIHLLVAKKGIKGEAELPHFKAKARKIEIASDETVKKLEEGKIDFDVLITTPAMMLKLLKFAKLLGPKGLMPNPKTGTMTDNPEKAAKEFDKTALSYKTEANAPLIHTVFGKISQPESELKANLQALIKAIGTQNIKKMTIKSTMGPGIKTSL